MGETHHDRERSPGGLLDRFLAASGLLLLAALLIVGQMPTEQLFPAREVVLPTTEAWLDSGACYVMRHDLGVESDKAGGHSEVRLLEDGAPLKPHTTHQDMRDGALGRFSHWGDHLYLSSSDGSDPRKNGREYRAVIPTELPAWVNPTMALTALGGLLLALAGVALSRRRRRSVWTDLVPVGAALTAFVILLPLETWVAPFRTLHRGQRQILGQADARALAHAATRPGNVTRLFSTDDAPRFEASAELPESDERVRLELVPSPGVEVVDGIARLEPNGPGLVAKLDPRLRVDQIGELMLPARVRAGEKIQVGLEVAGDTGGPKVQIDIPVATTAEFRPLRVTNALELFLADPRSQLEAIHVLNPYTSRSAVLVELDEIVVSSPATAFLESTNGQRDLAIEKQARPTTWQSVAGRFRLPIPAGRGSLLKGAVGLFGRRPATPVPWRVSHVDAQGGEQVVLEGELPPGQRWVELRGQIPREGITSRDAGELVLEVTELPAGTAFGWSGWRLVDDARPAQRVIVMLLDTLRRDALGVFGGTEAETPFLDALARDGVRFSRCYSQAHWTRPSMPSLMTSRYVASTGVETLGNQLPESYVTLAEAFAEAGYYTIADIANTNAGPAAGLAQGWDHMHHSAKPSESDAARQLLGGDLVAQLRDTVEEDLVLYIHLMDAHGPYGPFDAPADADAPELAADATPVPRDPALDREWTQQPTAEGRRHWYYRDVETLDRGLSEFFAALDGIWGGAGTSAATVALTADHGEYLGEYDQWGHGWFGELPEVVNVPMFVRSARLPGGRLIETPVENIDLGVSLLELADISATALGDVDGRSLLPLILEGDASQHGVALAAVGQKHQTKLLGIYAEHGALLGSQGELTSLIDPSEVPPAMVATEEIPGGGTILGSGLTEELGTRFAKLWSEHLAGHALIREDLWADVDTSSTTIDPLALQQLEALGYLGDD